jgi:hypothetical protein
MICELCEKEYEEYFAGKYIPEINGNNYCETCRNFLKSRLKSKKRRLKK